MTATAMYEETRFRLNPGERLTLLTDGIPEARNREGHLFGFDRTAAISKEPADAIVDTVRAFGQPDDVTVVRLGLAAAPVLAGA